MSVSRLIFAVALLFPRVVAGQSVESAKAVGVSASVVRPVDGAAVSPQRPSASALTGAGDSTLTRRSVTRRGAIIGAVVGGVIGAVGGTQLHIGCEGDRCNPQVNRTLTVVSLAAIGSLLGSGVGAIIGYVSSTK